MLSAGKILIQAFASALANANAAATSFDDCIPPPVSGPHAAYIPNLMVRTHQDQMARFYEDLVRQKIVLISCVSTRNESSCSNHETLVKVQSLIGQESGRSVFMYSITTDPEHDTPARLRAFAEKYGAGDGWLFLTGDPAALKTLRQRLFTQGGQDCSMHLIRYGNEAVGLWGGILATAAPESIAQRVSWLTPGERPSGPPKRGGPPPLAAEG
jgi:protein SCO1/2